MPLLSARETAYQTIRSRIITMELKPGDPLNDRELAEELGISRTPMREALLMLNLARMVDIKPQSGTPCGTHQPEVDGDGAVCPLYTGKRDPESAARPCDTPGRRKNTAATLRHTMCWKRI